MNVKLSHNVQFSAVVIEGTNIFPNFYTVKINMDVLTDNNLHQNIAIQRILIFLEEVFDGSVFCSEHNPNALKFVRLAKDSQIILFPEEPFDQVVGMILFHKLNAITDGKLQIDDVVICSNLAQNLTFTINEYVDFNYTLPQAKNFKLDDPWWDRSDLSVSNKPNQIKLSDSWEDVNLEWDSETTTFDIECDLGDNQKHTEVIILDGGASNGS